MAEYYSNQALDSFTAPIESAQGDVKVTYGVIDLADVATLGVNDILHFCWLPAKCKTLRVDVRADDMDTNATETIAWDLGVIDPTAAASDPDLFIVGSIVGQDPGDDTADSLAHRLFAPADNDRRVSMTITTAAATKATTGKVHVWLEYTSEDGRP